MVSPVSHIAQVSMGEQVMNSWKVFRLYYNGVNPGGVSEKAQYLNSKKSSPHG